MGPYGALHVSGKHYCSCWLMSTFSGLRPSLQHSEVSDRSPEGELKHNPGPFAILVMEPLQSPFKFLKRWCWFHRGDWWVWLLMSSKSLLAETILKGCWYSTMSTWFSIDCIADGSSREETVTSMGPCGARHASVKWLVHCLKSAVPLSKSKAEGVIFVLSNLNNN